MRRIRDCPARAASPIGSARARYRCRRTARSTFRPTATASSCADALEPSTTLTRLKDIRARGTPVGEVARAGAARPLPDRHRGEVRAVGATVAEVADRVVADLRCAAELQPRAHPAV